MNDAKGGARRGAGRPKGAVTRVSLIARAEAKALGLLPHEWLLKIARGEPVEQTYWKDVLDSRGNFKCKELVTEDIYPTIDMRADCAKAAAPYYAPRLATQVITVRTAEDKFNDMDDKSLDDMIKMLSKGAKKVKGDDQS
jgi:hypothetical protein